MVWLKLDIDLPLNSVWVDLLGSRLWIWLLCTAKRANQNGSLRFSYGLAADALKWEGQQSHGEIRPTRKALRGALERLAEAGRIAVPTRAQRRVQGRVQGHFDVTICNWKTYQGRGAGAGTRPGRARAERGQSAGTASRDRELERDSEPKKVPPPELVEGKEPTTNHQGCMAAIKDAYVEVFGVAFPGRLGRWSKAVQALVGRGETPETFLPVVRAHFQQCRDKEWGPSPEHFIDKYDVLKAKNGQRQELSDLLDSITGDADGPH